MAFDIEKIIEDKLANFMRKFIVLIITSAEKHIEAERAVLRLLTIKKGMPGVYITFSKPYATLKAEFDDAGIDQSKIFFLDMFSQSTGVKQDRVPNCFFISSPKNLKELLILLEEALGRLPKENRFVFIDSISSMLIYNSEGSVLKFIHTLTGKMRLLNITGIIFLLERRTDEDLINRIMQFCDRTITLL